MGEQTEARYLVMNPREQSLDVHLPGRSEVVPPHGQLRLDEAELRTLYVRVLLRRRLLVLQPGQDEAREAQPA